MNYSFDSIAGYEREKEELKQLCEILNDRKNCRKKGAKLPKGVIFYGGTGTGKTLFSKVLESECGLKTFKIDLGNVDNETAICKKIRKAFADASKRNEPSMIFLDEIDKVVPASSQPIPSDREKTVLTQLLTLIDGMDSSGNFIFVATCNDYGNLPEPLVRPGRIDKKIFIGLPSCASRAEILKTYAQKSACRFEIPAEETAKLCVGFSCAGLETLVNECVLCSDADGFIPQTLVLKKIAEIKNEDISRKICPVSDTIDACRNIGSFIVAKNFCDGDCLLTLEQDTVCNTYFNNLIHDYDDDYEEDYDDDYDDEEDDGKEQEDDSGEWAHYFTKQDCVNAVCALLGGYAAEELIFGKVYDNVSASLWTADKVLFGMSDNGLLGLNLRYSVDRRDKLSYPPARITRINAELEKIYSDCYFNAQKIIRANEVLIKKLIPVLVRERSMDRDACDAVLSELGGMIKV